MITKEQVEKIINEKIAGTDIFLVDVMIGSGNSIHVHIDTFKGISIDECVEMNRYIVGRLDKDLEDYDLEVSSPGLDAPFKVDQQFEKNIGKQVEIIKKDGIKFTAVLKAYFTDGIEIEQMGKPQKSVKSKDPVPQVTTMQLADIKSIKSHITFK